MKQVFRGEVQKLTCGGGEKCRGNVPWGATGQDGDGSEGTPTCCDRGELRLPWPKKKQKNPLQRANKKCGQVGGLVRGGSLQDSPEVRGVRMKTKDKREISFTGKELCCCSVPLEKRRLNNNRGGKEQGRLGTKTV